MFTWKEYRNIRREQFGENRTDSKYNYQKYRLHNMKKSFYETESAACGAPISLVCTNPCPPATTASSDWCKPIDYDKPQQKGNNPMATTMTATSLNIAIPKSDEMAQRDYLISEFSKEFEGWRDPMQTKLSKMFNLNAPKTPATAEDLVAAIKGGKFTIDPKLDEKRRKRYEEVIEEDDFEGTYEEFLIHWYGTSPFQGMTFTDLPKADRKGYDAAYKQWEDAKRDARTKLMILPPTEGLDLLLSLRNWTPTGKAN